MNGDNEESADRRDAVRSPVVMVRAIQNHTVRITQNPAIVMRAMGTDAGYDSLSARTGS